MKILSLIFILTLSTSVLAQPVVKVLKEVALVRSGRIFLKDIIDNNSLNKELLRVIGRIDLGNVPELGERRIFKRQHLSEIIRKKAEFKNYTIIIPKETLAFRAHSRLTGPSVSKQFVKKWQNDCVPCKIEITNLVLPDVTQLVSWKIGDLKSLPRGSFNLPILVTTLNHKSRSFWVSGKVKVRKVVPVLLRQISFGQRLQPYDVKMKEMDVTYLSKNNLSLEDVLGKKLTRSHRANEVLERNNIYRERALKRGEIVRVKVGSSMWEISIDAQAEQSGYIGELVKMKNLQSGKMFSARVLGNGEAIVE
ncbi:MAG: flagellar basal body P-ring formation protein FlgA [Bdellovibrionaceae bacterium]|nr:flagellar basal body P-ring formation protein FlgA [Pseudobdellovibrionaceae bacterium]